MISPFKGGTLKVANASAHDISFNVTYMALDLMKQDSDSEDVEKAKHWEDLARLLTDDTDVTSWRGKEKLVKEACQVKHNK
jgi:hypothetical protein